ncbi:helix-turn-helix transcriptional regulator [Allokutzneria multivorans]|uniref:Helix-turn-helix transcriptional regulator n=1 Tax=Allokutzneria multivorans TaxID=1142134 RepID=A0ABP7SXX4_9PSEU
MLDPDRLPDDRHDLASVLRALRRAAGLSGERLAARCTMSQTKISRIETGRAVPTVAEVERILHALGTPPDVAERMLQLARVANTDFTSLRAYAEAGLWRAQDAIKALIRSATLVRQFLPVMPSGLLQTPDYARTVLTPAIPGKVKRDVERAVAARLSTQDTLSDHDRRFLFLLTENAIRWPVGNPDIMAAECDRLAQVAEYPNVELAILPRDAWLPIRPLNYFTIYDDRLVTVELFSGVMTHRDPKDITQHAGMFDALLDHAVSGEAARELLSRIRSDFMRQVD